MLVQSTTLSTESSGGRWENLFDLKEVWIFLYYELSNPTIMQYCKQDLPARG